METRFVEANGQRLFVRSAGRPDAPLLLLLHGFPEYGGAWDAMLPRFADAFLAVAPDQRGYGLSSKPIGVEHYRLQHLAADMLALAEAIAPGRPVHLVGHDWGASVAYMMAFLQPKKIAKLVIINGVHPGPFQHALLHDAEQRAASQYIRFLRRDDAAPLLLEDGCRRTFAILSGGFGGGRWLTDDLKAKYLEAWQQPGAMGGMVAWYKATPLSVLEVGAPVEGDPMARIKPELLRVRMPHLLIWGQEDKALRPSCRVGLEDYCDDLTVIEVDDADHWIIHQKPDLVAREIGRFCGAA